MSVPDLCCLLTNSGRAKAYIQKLVAAGLAPQRAVCLDLFRAPSANETPRAYGTDLERAVDRAFNDRKYFLYADPAHSVTPAPTGPATLFRTFDPDKPVTASLEEAGVPFEHVAAETINDTKAVAAVSRAECRYTVFSGGGILRADMLAAPTRFIHVHPGHVPYVRGSMAVEWSILVRGTCAATAFLMAAGIDMGEVIAVREFEPPPLEHNGIPRYYSAHIRSELLVEVVRRFAETGELSAEAQPAGAGHTYYKMHPALGNVVLYRCRQRSVNP